MDIDFSKGLPVWCGQGGLHFQPTQAQEEEIIAFVDHCAMHGITRLHPAILRSDYFSRFINFEDDVYHRDVVTKKEFYSKWDPLKVLIQLAHDRGIEVHPYLNYNLHGTRWPDSGSALVNNTIFGEPVASKLITMGVSKFASDNRKFWKKDRNGRDSFSLAEELRLSDAYKEVRDYEQDQLLDLITEYEPDGVQLEFSQEPMDDNGVSVYGYEEPAVEAFEEKFGYSPFSVDNSDLNWIRFRGDYLNTFIRELHKKITQLSIEVPLTLSVIAANPPEPNSYINTLRDWPAWVQEGEIDAVCLWFREFIDLDSIPEQTRQAVKLIDGKCPLIAELSTYHRGSLKTPTELIEAARRARDGGADVIGVYRAEAIEAQNLWSAVQQIGEFNNQ